jgi:hypothetical protein
MLRSLLSDYAWVESVNGRNARPARCNKKELVPNVVVMAVESL